MNRKQWLMVKLVLLTLIFITVATIGFRVTKNLGKGGIGFDSSMKNSVPIVEGEKVTFENVQKIIIDTINLPVEIQEGDVSEVTIQDNSTAHGVGTKKPNKVAYEDGTLSFKQVKQRPLFFSISGNVIVEVPKGSLIEYELESVSGYISHNAPSKGKLKADTISGAIKIHQSGEKLSAESISGSIKIYQGFKETKVETISGSIKLEANQDSEQISGSSVSGSFQIALKNVSGYMMDYSTVSSSVKDSYANIDYSKSGNATNGDGSLKINLSSVSGSINLTDW